MVRPSRRYFKNCIYLPVTIACGPWWRAKNLSPNNWKQSAAVYISFEAGGQVFQDIFTGDSDWREMELNFEVKTKTKLHVYFFNYGSGSFFVDHIRTDAAQGMQGGKNLFIGA